MDKKSEIAERVRKMREKDKQKGLVRVEVKVPAKSTWAIIDFASILRGGRKELNEKDQLEFNRISKALEDMVKVTEIDQHQFFCHPHPGYVLITKTDIKTDIQDKDINNKKRGKNDA